MNNKDWLQEGCKANTPKGVAIVRSITDEHGVNTHLGNFCRSEMTEYNPKNYVRKHKGYVIPEGAEKFLNLCRIKDGRHEFYKMVDGQIWYFDYDDKVWSKAKGKANYHKAEDLPKLPEQDLPNWDDAPEWADRLMKCRSGGYYFSNMEQYFHNSTHDPLIYGARDAIGINYDYEDFELIEMRPIAETVIPVTETVFRNNKDTLGPYEVAPIAIEDKEWLPVVGEECEALDTLMAHPSYCFAKIKGFYNKQVWLTSEAGVELVLFISDLKFRPLKTAEELERDAFAELAFRRVNVDAKYSKVLNSIVDQLFDAGFTAPKGEG